LLGGTVATGFAGIYEAIITDISGLTTGMLVAWVHIDTDRGRDRRNYLRGMPEADH
jgi:hypothetical protein